MLSSFVFLVSLLTHFCKFNVHLLFLFALNIIRDFKDDSFKNVCKCISEEKDDYGIVPMPKFDEEQKDYISQIGTSTCMVYVPVTAKDPALTSKVMELLSYFTNQLVVPKYYEVALKEKYARDTDIAEMLDIIRDGATIDFLFVYGMQLSQAPNNQFRLGKADPSASDIAAVELSSDFESRKSAFITSLEQLAEKYEALE